MFGDDSRVENHSFIPRGVFRTTELTVCKRIWFYLVRYIETFFVLYVGIGVSLNSTRVITSLFTFLPFQARFTRPRYPTTFVCDPRHRPSHQHSTSIHSQCSCLTTTSIMERLLTDITKMRPEMQRDNDAEDLRSVPRELRSASTCLTLPSIRHLINQRTTYTRDCIPGAYHERCTLKSFHLGVTLNE